MSKRAIVRGLTDELIRALSVGPSERRIGLVDLLLNSWVFFSTLGSDPRTWAEMATGGAFEKTWSELV